MSDADHKNEISKSYNAHLVEKKWREAWEKTKIFEADAARVNSGEKKPYVIMMPPPNVTGVLHNGHALFVTLQDILIRYHRMLGKEVLWLPGVDHAGIATQTVVERELKKQNIERKKIGREAFLEHIWAWKDKNGEKIVEQMKLLGASADWSRLRFTMDEQCSHAVKKAFVSLWEDDLIYRGERLVNWDPGTQTAISDEEVEHEDRKTELYSFAYKIKNSKNNVKEIIVATTRPETMLGDTGIAVNPEDERYKNLVGCEVEHPFFASRSIKIVADDYVDQEFGSGAVKITPAHDPNDFEIGQRHKLEFINILTKDAKVNHVHEKFSGLTVLEARKQIKQDLEHLGLFRKTEELEHAVSVSQRSGAVIEPMLSRQYFLKTDKMAHAAQQSVAGGETKMVPESWRKTWDNFLLNNRDWCISRQLWWGHRIPVYYHVESLKSLLEKKKSGDAYELLISENKNTKQDIHKVLKLALSELTEQEIKIISKASAENLADTGEYIQEEDVLDTWFSSGLWPFSTLGWPDDNSEDLKAFYPGAVLETGFDILFFWVARMVMFGIHFMGKSPFEDIYLHAMVRDAHGRKMSKSLGNAVDPIDVVRGIELGELREKIKNYPVPEKMLPKVLKGLDKEYPDGIPASGADGLRLSLSILSGQGRDVKLAIPRVSGYRSFLNKVWNACRFAMMRVEPGAENFDANQSAKDLNLINSWILSELNKTIKNTNKSLKNYRFDLAADGIYQFFWTEFCDWYLELSKVIFESDDSLENKKLKEETSSVLLYVLENSMRLLHPFCPFISEEIWQSLNQQTSKENKFCATAAYPIEDKNLESLESESQINVIKSIVTSIRNLRQESGLSARKPVDVTVAGGNLKQIELNKNLLIKLACLNKIDLKSPENFAAPSESASQKLDNFTVCLNLEGLIDKTKERERLERELNKITKELMSLSGRLSSENFVKRAPEAVVVAARVNLKNLEEKKLTLEESLRNL